MNKIMKMLVAAVLVAGVSSAVRADNFGSVSLSVTVTGTLDLTLTSTVTAFGSVAPGASAVSSGAIGINNTSVGIIQTYSLQSFDSAPWTIQPAAGPNQFSLKGLFNAAAPVVASFNAIDSISTSTARATTAAASAGKFEGDQSGANVAPASSRNLWFRFDAPTSTASFGSRVLTVTILAELP